MSYIRRFWTFSAAAASFRSTTPPSALCRRLTNRSVSSPSDVSDRFLSGVQATESMQSVLEYLVRFFTGSELVERSFTKWRRRLVAALRPPASPPWRGRDSALLGLASSVWTSQGPIPVARTRVHAKMFFDYRVTKATEERCVLRIGLSWGSKWIGCFPVTSTSQEGVTTAQHQGVRCKDDTKSCFKSCNTSPKWRKRASAEHSVSAYASYGQHNFLLLMFHVCRSVTFQ
eukprot:scpid39119/ scgid16834/ 